MFGFFKNRPMQVSMTDIVPDGLMPMPEYKCEYNYTAPEEEDISIISNVISEEYYQAEATKALNVISSSLKKSLGYYGSTTIIEDVALGNTVTKDGFTILRSLKFDSENTIANSLLRSIRDISQELVMEVGDGSTSAIVTAEAVFTAMTDGDNTELFKKYPPRIIYERLKELEARIVPRLTAKARPITEENFEVLKHIAGVSNNNDDHMGNLLHEIYKHIGSNGYISIEGAIQGEDRYELTNGIELGYGLIQQDFAYSANKFMSDYRNEPYIFLIKGRLRQKDIDWFGPFLGFFWGNMKAPIVVVADGYDTDFVNFLKINLNKNMNQGVSISPTVFNTSKREAEYYDLAAYLGAKVLNLNEVKDVLDPILDPLYKGDPVNCRLFIENYLGRSKEAYLDANTTRFTEGRGSKEDVDVRITAIDQDIEYLKSISDKKDVSKDLYNLEKRKANLRGLIAKLFITGKTNLEIETRKYLIEDAVHASRSALQHGYLPGGNLSVPKVLKSLKVKKGPYQELDARLIEILSESFQETFYGVLANSFMSEEEQDAIVGTCVAKNKVYNLKTRKYENDSTTKIINSVRTDIRILESVISIIGILVTSNQYVKRLP